MSPRAHLLCRLACAAAMAMGASCSREQAAPSGEYVAISAVELGRAYADSPSSAQEDYGKRRLRVTGTVTGITSDAADHAVIKMKGPTELIDVYLTLLDEEKDKAVTVQKGSELTLHCEGATLIIGSPTLDGCTFDPAAAKAAVSSDK